MPSESPTPESHEEVKPDYPDWRIEEIARKYWEPLERYESDEDYYGVGGLFR